MQLYGGAALATAARLKWDPSTYVVLREMFPAEYRAAAAALTAGGAALLLLPHVAAAALHAARPLHRSVLLYVVSALLSLVLSLTLNHSQSVVTEHVGIKVCSQIYFICFIAVCPWYLNKIFIHKI